MNKSIKPFKMRIKAKLSVIGFFAILIAVLFAVGQYFLFANSEQQKYTIELRGGGFYPGELSITKGDKVRFVNKREQSFWPASDPHPTHDIYHGFDSKKPIDAGKSWSFKFNKEGIFKYHDHLFPSLKGTIMVGKNDISFGANKESCAQIKDKFQQITCWESLLEKTLNKDGLDEGFKLFRELAQFQPEICHRYAHDLGEYAFKTYSARKNIQIMQETSYCGYGFWHGFMEKMIAFSDFEKAKQFCESLTSPTPELLPVIRLNCYHGIGIGLISDPPPIKFWGVAQPLIERSLGYCDTIKTESLRSYCHSGVFHAIIDYMMAKQYKFDVDKNNPFALCFEQKEKYRLPCYLQVAPNLMVISDNNLTKAFNFLKKIPEASELPDISIIALTNFVNQRMLIQDYGEFLHRCRSLGLEILDTCLPALTNSLFATGRPDQEYLKVIDMCNSNYLDDSGKLFCFQKVIATSKQLYSTSKNQEICGLIERNYRKLCN